MDLIGPQLTCIVSLCELQKGVPLGGHNPSVYCSAEISDPYSLATGTVVQCTNFTNLCCSPLILKANWASNSQIVEVFL